MYRGMKIALLLPAYREERLIGPTLKRVPDYFDRVYVVDDKSPDHQNEIILQQARQDSRVTLLKHEVNQGPGASLITGYLQSSKDGFDITVVAGADNQMPLEESPNLIDPIIDEGYDYVKGNRFMSAQIQYTLAKMPKLRVFGNTIIAAMSKISTGYYKTMDFVEGFTAITKNAIDTINWEIAWKGYGYPMDFLARLNAYGFRVKDVPRTAIYLEGERQSQIKGLRYALKVTPMLIRNFFWRLNYKYLYRDFHPLVLFYYLGMLLLPLGLVLGGYLIYDKLFGLGTAVTGSRSVLCALLIFTGFQSILFAMLFDMEVSEK